ncbi:hypothetical protein [Mesorhizobium sp. AR07]|uniref:hypothetical protein n=1 Tax=Mesorhizobium sp. AR07 TaxID=2865838 RepID=UPI00215FB2CF|nr:hypothetical protein [Mesorhizobium sp. AR07]
MSDLKRLVTPAAVSTNFPSENGSAREKVDETARRACTDLGQADEPDIRTPQAGSTLEGMSKVKRAKALLTFAQILLQAAGLVIKELDDDQH